MRPARIIHASAFALASTTTRQAIEFAFNRAHRLGKIISFDPNYSPLIWSDRREALRVMAGLYPLVTVTKPSLDDARRLFGPGHTSSVFINWVQQLLSYPWGRTGCWYRMEERYDALLRILYLWRMLPVQGMHSGRDFSWAYWMTAHWMSAPKSGKLWRR